MQEAADTMVPTHKALFPLRTHLLRLTQVPVLMPA